MLITQHHNTHGKQAGAELCQAQGKFSLAYYLIGEAPTHHR